MEEWLESFPVRQLPRQSRLARNTSGFLSQPERNFGAVQTSSSSCKSGRVDALDLIKEQANTSLPRLEPARHRKRGTQVLLLRILDNFIMALEISLSVFRFRRGSICHRMSGIGSHRRHISPGFGQGCLRLGFQSTSNEEHRIWAMGKVRMASVHHLHTHTRARADPSSALSSSHRFPNT